MCYHYRGVKQNPDKFVAGFSIRSNLRLTVPTLATKLNPPEGFWPTKNVPVIRLDANGDRELVEMEWGLLPFWWKPSDKRTSRAAFQRKCANAVSEELESKASYREPFKRRRCLMPAGEFMEPNLLFRLPGDEMFAFASLWDEWRGPDGEIVQSCTMLTTDAVAEVAPVNDRMPLLLTTEAQYERWLDPEITTRAPLQSVMWNVGDGVLLSREYVAPPPTERKRRKPRDDGEQLLF